jgi:Holliday junction resolvasome RuvABC ATP-dependent DNA helicase subunit
MEDYCIDIMIGKGQRQNPSVLNFKVHFSRSYNESRAFDSSIKGSLWCFTQIGILQHEELKKIIENSSKS